MKKISLLFFSLFLLSISFPVQYLSAQDTLYKENGSKQIINIININETQVKYRLASDTGQTIYAIHKNDINRIAYKDGVIHIFPKDPSFTIKKTSPRQMDFRRHFMALTITDFLAPALTFNYEYIFRSGSFGLKLPVSFALSKQQNQSFFRYYEDVTSKPFSVGLNINIYPYGQGIVRYYWGPATEIGTLENSAFNPALQTKKDKMTFYTLLLENGILIQPTKRFCISAFVSGGGSYILIKEYYAYATHDYYESKHLDFACKWGVNIGVKF